MSREATNLKGALRGLLKTTPAARLNALADSPPNLGGELPRPHVRRLSLSANRTGCGFEPNELLNLDCKPKSGSYSRTGARGQRKVRLDSRFFRTIDGS